MTKYPQSTLDTPKIYPWYTLEMKYTWNRTSWNEGWQTNDEKLKGLVSLWNVHRKWQFILNLLNCFVSEPTKCWLILIISFTSNNFLSSRNLLTCPCLHTAVHSPHLNSWYLHTETEVQSFSHNLNKTLLNFCSVVTTTTQHYLGLGDFNFSFWTISFQILIYQNNHEI